MPTLQELKEIREKAEKQFVEDECKRIEENLDQWLLNAATHSNRLTVYSCWNGAEARMKAKSWFSFKPPEYDYIITNPVAKFAFDLCKKRGLNPKLDTQFKTYIYVEW